MFSNNKEEGVKARCLISLVLALALSLGWSPAWTDADERQFPQNATFTTLITTPRAIEGLTGDNHGNLYIAGSVTVAAAHSLPGLENQSQQTHTDYGRKHCARVRSLATCGFAGIAFNDIGDVFVADGAGARIFSFTPNASNPPTVTAPFASGTPGANGLAFDEKGNLWASDGTTGRGTSLENNRARSQLQPPQPAVNCEEVFRIQPMANEVNLSMLTTPIVSVRVGRDNRALPLGTITVTPTTRNAANTIGFSTARGQRFSLQ